MHADLITALEKSASPVPAQRYSGDSELKALETRPGFHVSLLSIFGDTAVKNSSRYLALIYLKNAVDQKWRRSAVFNTETKQVIRDQLLNYITAPSTVQHPQMVKQLAIIVADISRTDYPRHWPNLLPDLHSLVLSASSDLQTLDAALEIMLQTLKKLGTTRIGMARTKLDQFSVESIEVYWQLFKSFQNYKALKIVGQLFCGGHARQHRFPGPQKVFHELFLALQSFYSQQNFKLVCRIGKILSILVEKHPLVYTGFGVDAFMMSQFYVEYLTSYPNQKNRLSNLENGSTNSKPVIQAMCIVRELTRFVKLESLQHSSLPLNMRPRDDTDREELEKAYQLMKSVFQPAILETLVTVLVEFYFTMTQEDLELWKDCPDEFVIEEATQSPEFSMVYCAELLFAHILKAWPTQMAPLAQSLIEKAVQNGHELGVEAALRALQFGADTFSESFELDPAVRMLVQNGGVNAGSPIIRRRLCRVIGGWIPVKSSEQLQAMAFELVRSTLQDKRVVGAGEQQEDWDIVVKLSALDLASICCDDIDFQPNLFAGAAAPVLTTIYMILQNPGSSTEIKLEVLKFLKLIIGGMGTNFSSDDMARVLEILPSLWETETERSNHHLVQGAVLQTLADLINSTANGNNDKFDNAYLIGVPLVDVASDPKQPLATYLMEDALNLWKALLVNARAAKLPSADSGTPSLASLFERVVFLIETHTEDLDQLLSILESYIWLDHTLAVPHYSRLLGNFSLYLSESCGLNETLLILLCTETLLNVSQGEQETLALQQTGLMQWMEQCVFRADAEDATMETLIEASKCLNVLSLAAVKTGGHGILTPQTLFPSWLNKLRGISDPRDRKLGSMGLTSLLVAHPQLLSQYGTQYIQIMGEIVEEIPESAGFSQFYHQHNDDKPTAEEERQTVARSNEVAVAVSLKSYIKDAAQHIHQTGDSSLLNAALAAGIIY